MKIDFDGITANDHLEGKLVYRLEEYSFDFLSKSQADYMARAGNQETTSLSIGTLQIEVGIATKRILYAWGYHAYFRWRGGTLSIPGAQKGHLQVTLNDKLMPGASVPLIDDGCWTTTYDAQNGWLCIGDDKILSEDMAIEFATSTIAVVRKKQLVGVWLCPEMVS